MAGEVPVHSLQRLADSLANTDGMLTWAVHGKCDAGRKPFLVIEVAGILQLECQRCLTALPFSLEIESNLQLVPQGAAWPDEALEDDSADPVQALDEQPLLPLIEDEVLLALPIAPRHASCPLPLFDDGGTAVSPFATLAQLKKH